MVRCRSVKTFLFDSGFILMNWKHPFVNKQLKWPLYMPLMPLVIVSSDDTLSQHKLKLISSMNFKNYDSRPQ